MSSTVYSDLAAFGRIEKPAPVPAPATAPTIPGLKVALQIVIRASCGGIVRVGKYRGRTYAEASFDEKYCKWVSTIKRLNGDDQFHAWIKIRQAAAQLN